jgi:hypothetical protein
VKKDAELKEADRLIVYAGGWQDNLGPAVTKRLMAMGYDDVYLFRGGLLLWEGRNGNPGANPGELPGAGANDDPDAAESREYDAK